MGVYITDVLIKTMLGVPNVSASNVKVSIQRDTRPAYC